VTSPDPDDYEKIGREFEAAFPSHCALNWDHAVKRGDRVSRIQRADNPMLPVTGVACKTCTKLIPRRH